MSPSVWRTLQPLPSSACSVVSHHTDAAAAKASFPVASGVDVVRCARGSRGWAGHLAPVTITTAGSDSALSGMSSRYCGRKKGDQFPSRHLALLSLTCPASAVSNHAHSPLSTTLATREFVRDIFPCLPLASCT